MKLTDYYRRYSIDRAAQISGDSLDAHLLILRRLREVAGNVHVAAITPAHVAAVCRRQAAVNTKRKWARNGRIIWGHAMALGLAKTNPWKTQPAAHVVVDREEVYVPADRAVELAAAGSDVEGPAWRRLIVLCRFTGLRISEAVSARAEDVDGDWLTVQHRGERTCKKRRRRAPLGPLAKGVLASAAPGRLCPVTAHEARLIYHRVVPRGDAWPQPFHALRASCETDWFKLCDPFDVARWLGHSPQVALTHYYRSKQTGVVEGIS